MCLILTFSTSMVSDSLEEAAKMSNCATNLDGQRCVRRDKRGRKANQVNSVLFV